MFIAMHGCTSSHLYNAGTEHVGFSTTRQKSREPSAKRREAFSDPMKGELDPTKNQL